MSISTVNGPTIQLDTHAGKASLPTKMVVNEVTYDRNSPQYKPGMVVMTIEQSVDIPAGASYVDGGYWVESSAGDDYIPTFRFMGNAPKENMTGYRIKARFMLPLSGTDAAGKDTFPPLTIKVYCIYIPAA